MPQPGAAELDGLLHRLEAQLRRCLHDPTLAVDLALAGRNWAERVASLAPALTNDARTVADALQGTTGPARAAGIGQAMRLIAKLRTQATALPGAEAAAPKVRPIVSPFRTVPTGAGATAAVAAPAASAPATAATPPTRAGAPGRSSPGPTPPASASNGASEHAATSGASAQPAGLQRAARPLAGPSRAAPTTAAVSEPPTKPRARTARKSPGPNAQNARATRPRKAAAGSLTLDSSVEALPGFRKAYAPAFQKLKLATLRDLLYHFPRRHQDYSKLLPIAQLRPGEEVTIEARVVSCQAVGFYNKPGRRVEAIFADATGTIRGVWFRQEWRAKQLRAGMQLYVSGKVEAFGGRLQFTHPDYELVTDEEAIHTGRLVPVYPLSGDLQGNWLRAKIKWVVDELAHTVEDPLPPAFRARWDLPPLHAALQQFHFPDDERELAIARRRIAFQDLLVLQLGLLQQKLEWERLPAIPLHYAPEQLAEDLGSLPFALTGDQRRALDEVLADITKSSPMARLLQGDVGSGKTVVAALAALAAADNGYQAAILAPTEVLAEQHARTLTKLYTALRPMLAPVLITGSMPAALREETWKQVASGQASVVVGTHALFSEGRAFRHLALLVVDEHHRFGVYQRDALWGKGEHPHLLAMTATPIPRTLARLQHGALELSTIRELPPGRTPILTRYAAAERRESVYAFIRAQVQQGRQAYVICPLVDESDKVAVKAVTKEYSLLKEEVFSGLRVGLLHGQLPTAEKNETMRRFRDHDLDILVATTVVEVGVDVPNATVILIEGADRFGLAQLHQLRGRVGRGSEQSYCILMSSEGVDEEGEARLRLVASTSDGFDLAEADLKLRKQGKLLGDEQSGKDALLRWAAFVDGDQVREAAEQMLGSDPALSRPEHRQLAARVAKVRKEQAGADADQPSADEPEQRLVYA